MPGLLLAPGATEALSRAKAIAKERGNSEIEPAHLFFALLVPNEGLIPNILAHVGVGIVPVREILDGAIDFLGRPSRPVFEPPSSSALRRVLEIAETERRVLEDRVTAEEHLLLALVSADGGIPSETRKEIGIKRQAVVEALRQIRSAELLAARPASDPASRAGQAGGAVPTTVMYCSDVTAAARLGRLDPVLKRDKEIQRTVEVLARRRKNNAVLVGEPGVGKTAIVDGLAAAVVNKAVPSFLQDSRILSLDLSAMVAGAKYKGEFEERLKKLLADLLVQPNVILFVDEMHMLLGAGGGSGGMDAANILKPALARGDLRVLGATTTGEYRRYIEGDPAFARRFVKVDVEEPDLASATGILDGIRPKYEQHHGVAITSGAIEAAVKLSKKFIPDRFLPDKAIDLMDEASADVRILAETCRLAQPLLEKRIAEAPEAREQHFHKADGGVSGNGSGVFDPIPLVEEAFRERGIAITEQSESDRWEKVLAHVMAFKAEVTDTEIARRVSIHTGIPVHRMVGDERKRLKAIEQHLQERIIGQEDAVSAVSDAIRRGRTRLKKKNTPVGRFLFLGPTGTGKTELAKALAAFLFNDEKAMIRFDMSEFKGEQTVQRLTGPPPGFVGYEAGGALTNGVLRRPYSVILFDEVEKADPQVLDVLLQILDDGRLTDGQSRLVDFSNAVVILTSNLCGALISGHDVRGVKLDDKMLRESLIAAGMRPELLNRFEKLLVFHRLTKKQVAMIVDLQIEGVAELLKEQEIKLEVTAEARELLARDGYDPEMGARPVARVIDDRVLSPLARLLIDAERPEGRTARVACVDGHLSVTLD